MPQARNRGRSGTGGGGRAGTGGGGRSGTGGGGRAGTGGGGRSGTGGGGRSGAGGGGRFGTGGGGRSGTGGGGRSAADWEPRKRSDLAGRVLVGVPAAVLAIVFVDMGGIGWMLLMGLLGCICLSELYPLLSDWRPVPVVGFAVVIGMCLSAHYGTLADVLGAALAALPLTFLSIVARGQSSESTLSLTSTLFGVFWIGFAFSLAILLRRSLHGNGIMIDVMLGTFLGDTAAYLGGRMFGRRPLAPTISPKKTIEGLGCGALVSILAVVVAGFYQDAWMPHGTALLLGVAVAAFGPIGDLFESLVKRDAGAKDAGTLFGAHGGALDRLDAVMFTVVVAFYIWTSVPR